MPKTKKTEDVSIGMSKMADANVAMSIESLTKAQQLKLKELDKGKGAISAKIRYLDTQRLTTSQIAKVLGKRYQHVRNVLTTELKRPVTD